MVGCVVGYVVWCVIVQSCGRVGLCGSAPRLVGIVGTAGGVQYVVGYVVGRWQFAVECEIFHSRAVPKKKKQH